MLVHELIFQGDPAAVAFQTATPVSYAQLQTEYQNYRNYFHHQGIRSGQNVGLFSRNSVEYVYCYMALTSLGAVVVPLNFQLTSREVAYIVKDSEMTHLVTMEHLSLADELAHHEYNVDVKQLIIADFQAEITGQALTPAPVLTTIDADTPCVIIYTSGTTGNPKGAMLTHKNAVNFMLPHKKNNYVNLIVENQWTWLSVVSVTFDPFVSDVFAPLGTDCA